MMKEEEQKKEGDEHKYGIEVTEVEKERLLEVLKSIPLEIGQFYVKSFQSYLFNRVVQWRIQHYQSRLLEGDQLRVSEDVRKGNEVRILQTEEMEEMKLEQVVLPLCG